ncbi:MAG: KTSC domain-containing protein [archaeon]
MNTYDVEFVYTLQDKDKITVSTEGDIQDAIKKVKEKYKKKRINNFEIINVKKSEKEPPNKTLKSVNIDSSLIKKAIYYRDKNELVVEFRNGGAYQYRDVEERVYRSLVTADSPGRYYNRHIKGKYFSLKLKEE